MPRTCNCLVIAGEMGSPVEPPRGFAASAAFPLHFETAMEGFQLYSRDPFCPARVRVGRVNAPAPFPVKCEKFPCSQGIRSRAAEPL